MHDVRNFPNPKAQNNPEQVTVPLKSVYQSIKANDIYTYKSEIYV